jgi:Zn-dependent protease with chaperone function
VAVALLIGFYALALGIAGGLLWTVYAQVVLAERVIVKLALVAVVLAGIIIWSVLPRFDRFEPPGPEIVESDHPRLFALIRDVASKTGQAMPDHVYLVSDVNAFVTQRGGIMGFFSRRVMGLGLPLLSLLSVSELRAVLAHEFGHFHGGDTKLGPWIYKTRSAMVRTVTSLADSLMRKPFEWYGTFFLKVTHSISREQELSADALAARVAGGRHLISGLKAVHGGAAAFGAFVQQEYGPVVQAGFRPPLAEGFRAFLDGKQVKASVERLVAKEIDDPEHDPFDTHPPLAQRIAALEGSDDALDGANTDDTPAFALLEDPDAVEVSLIRSDDGRPLERLTWAKVTERVFLPQWQEQANQVVEQLGSVTLISLVRSPGKLGKLAAKLLKQDLSEHPDVAARIGASFCGSAVVCTLANAGWTLKNRVGRPVVLKKDEQKLLPFRDFTAVADGDLAPEELAMRLTEAGVGELTVHTTT